MQETGCNETWQVFLNESPHLREFAEGWRQGIHYNTSICGRSLQQILNSSEVVTNNSVRDAALVEISSKLQKVESDLSKLSHSIVDSSPLHCDSSPSLLSASSPFYPNVTNSSTPITSGHAYSTLQNNAKTECSTAKPDSSTVALNTPLKRSLAEEGRSPRRKSIVPRRRIINEFESSPFKSPFKSPKTPASQSSVYSDSSQAPSSPTSPKSGSEIPLVEPGLIFEELINCPNLHEILADNINRAFNNDESTLINDNLLSEANALLTLKPSETNNSSDLQEIHLADNAINDIVSSVECEPLFNDILNMIAEKELQLTPFKDLKDDSSPMTSSISAFSSPLTTPKTQRTQSSESTNNAKKDLMVDLRTPDKNGVTLYAGSPRNFLNKAPCRITNVTPVKIVVPDFNVLTHSPNRNVFTQQNKILLTNSAPTIVSQNSITHSKQNSGTGGYFIKIGETSELQTTVIKTSTVTSMTKPKTSLVTSNNHSKKQPKGKKVNFTKPQSNLQLKVPIMPLKKTVPLSSSQRKILPKPDESGSGNWGSLQKGQIDLNRRNSTSERSNKHSNVVRSLEFTNVDPKQKKVENACHSQAEIGDNDLKIQAKKHKGVS